MGGQGLAPLPKSWVTINVEGKPVGFMVGTGAQYSVLNQKFGLMSKKTSLVQGATGTKRYYWTTKRKVDLGAQRVSHSFLVILDEPPNVMPRVRVPKTENKTSTAMQKHEGVLFLAQARAPTTSNTVEWSKEPRAQIYSSIYRF